MQAYEFNSVVGNEGIIYIPQQYLTKIFSPVKVIILTNDEPQKKMISQKTLKKYLD